jgi:hypothetical protein
VSESLSGRELAAALRVAADHLAAAAPAIDAINVYPVPDGDTGSNMAATLHAAIQAIEGEESATEVLRAVAKGALYGARGNSGVILSQALRGLAAASDAAELTPPSLVRALESAASAAYASMSQPQEGTMLTVLRVAAGSAAGNDCLAVLRSALAAAEEAERETINQLERLREAGVPDAGGEGICAILRAIVASLAGEPLPEVRLTEVPLARLVDHGEEYGFCTEFMLEAASGKPMDIAAVRSLVEGDGNRSAIVVGDDSLIRVHVHSDEPDRTIEKARRFGAVASTKIEDMGAQHRTMRARQSERDGVAMLALCDGEGFAQAFESLGATVLPQRGMQRPSVQQVLAALESMTAATVIVLPNHKDLIPVANQASALWPGTALVVETRSQPEGLAAALSFDSAVGPGQCKDSMSLALAGVTTIECTVAIETRVADGVSIAKGDVITLVNGRVVAAVTTLKDGLLAGLRGGETGPESLVTIYAGESLEDTEAHALGASVEENYPGTEVEVTRGGQGLYPVVASVE